LRDKTSKVSVCVITYNHEKYIRQCIQGIVDQITDFDIEVIIGEDCSTDDTRTVICEFKEKYPNTVNPIFRNKNIGAISNFYDVLRVASGKYIALCEGDDYWTDPLKLQKQVDFLEANEDCSLCFHATEFVYANNPKKNFIHRPKRTPKDFKFEMKHAILGGGGFMATNSMFFKKECLNERPEWMDKAPVGDLPLMLLLASQGKIGYIDEIMAAYRVMTENSWSSAMQDQLKKKKNHYAILKTWDDFDIWSEKKYHQFVIRKKLKNKWIYLKSKLSNIIE
jgi:glycosyltransferase involved in cell wall biosynthesis